jgi:hypothetical protein
MNCPALRPLLLAALGGLLLSGTALADHPFFPDSPTAQKGLAQYDNLDLEAAAASLSTAAKDTKVPEAERATILIYAGLVEVTLGKEDEAKKFFADAVDLDPKVHFPADDAPAKVTAMLDEIRKSKAPAEKIDLTQPPKKEKEEKEWAETGTETKETPSGGGNSHLGLILGISGGVVAVAAVVIILAVVLKPAGCTNSPAGTGCINVTPNN